MAGQLSLIPLLLLAIKSINAQNQCIPLKDSKECGEQFKDFDIMSFGTVTTAADFDKYIQSRRAFQTCSQFKNAEFSPSSSFKYTSSFICSFAIAYSTTLAQGTKCNVGLKPPALCKSSAISALEDVAKATKTFCPNTKVLEQYVMYADTLQDKSCIIAVGNEIPLKCGFKSAETAKNYCAAEETKNALCCLAPKNDIAADGVPGATTAKSAVSVVTMESTPAQQPATKPPATSGSTPAQQPATNPPENSGSTSGSSSDSGNIVQAQDNETSAAVENQTTPTPNANGGSSAASSASSSASAATIAPTTTLSQGPQETATRATGMPTEDSSYPTETPGSGEKSNSLADITSISPLLIGACAVGVALLAILVSVLCFYRKRRREQSQNTRELNNASKFESVYSKGSGIPSSVPLGVAALDIGEETMEVIFEYKANLFDELTLDLGDEVQVLNQFDDGWALGKNLSSGKEGTFPLACIAPFGAGSEYRDSRYESQYSKRDSSIRYTVESSSLARQTVDSSVFTRPY